MVCDAMTTGMGVDRALTNLAVGMDHGPSSAAVCAVPSALLAKAS